MATEMAACSSPTAKLYSPPDTLVALDLFPRMMPRCPMAAFRITFWNFCGDTSLSGWVSATKISSAILRSPSALKDQFDTGGIKLRLFQRLLRRLQCYLHVQTGPPLDVGCQVAAADRRRGRMLIMFRATQYGLRCIPVRQSRTQYTQCLDENRIHNGAPKISVLLLPPNPIELVSP